MIADLIGFRQFLDDRASGFRDLAAIRRRAQKNDEFVAAELRDEIRRGRRRQQAFRHRAEQLVAYRMTQRVIDLLELVEVDEHHRARQIRRRRNQQDFRAFVEFGPVGQARQRIEPGQFVDARLRNLSLGDVLEQYDGASVGHGLQGQIQHAAIRRLHSSSSNVPPPIRKCRPFMTSVISFLQDPACFGGPAKQFLDRDFRVGDAGLQLQESDQALVGHHDVSLRVEHRQSIRHVVQRRVELIRQHAHVSRPEQSVEINPAQSK